MADIFQKAFDYTAYNEVKKAGYYPYYREICSGQDTEVFINDKKFIMMGSNSYLGLTSNEEVKNAAIEAVQKYGTGNAGSRFLNGTLDIHHKLEKELADFIGYESCLLFGTGYMANLGVISSLVGPKDYIIIDKMNHASIYDAASFTFGQFPHSNMKANDYYGKLIKYKHNDIEHLEKILSKLDNDRAVVLVVDGVFSMEGDIVKLPEIIKLKEKYNFRIIVDDAHSTGVLGKNGRGTMSHFGLTTRDVDITVTTFSKTFAALGGAVLADKVILDYLKHTSRPVIFSASPTPASTMAVLKSLEILKREPERVDRLWEITIKMRTELKKMGFKIGPTETPIIPIFIGKMHDCFTFWKEVTNEGVFVNPVVPPAVPENNCLIRISFMSTHTEDQIDYSLQVFEKIGRKLKII
jgi:8-amino-7-oxononanoate synthase